MTQNKDMAPNDDAPASAAAAAIKTSPKSIKKQDPTARWSERVRDLPSRQHRPINYLKNKDVFEDDAQSIKTELHHLVETTQSCIVKRPLTSMVIAITAGAAIAALLAAAIGGKKDT